MFDFFDFHELAITAINIVALWLVLLVIANSKEKRVKYLFLLMTLGLIFWVDFAYLARVVDSSDLSLIFLRIAWFVTPFFFLFIYFFSLSIFNVVEKYKVLSIFNTALTFIISILSFTDAVIKNRIMIGGSLVIAYGNFMSLYLALGIVLMFSVLYIVINHIRNLNRKELQFVKPFIYGLVIFYVLNAVFNITLPVFFGITRLYFLGDYSTIILVALIAYSIFRYRFLGVKMLLSSLLLSVIGMLLLLDIFVLSQNTNEQILKGIIFIFFVFLGFYLQRSITKEVEQREKIEQINKELKKSQTRYKELAREQKDIIDVMGHEIRTPLTAIVQEINLLKSVVIPNQENFAGVDCDTNDVKEKASLVFEALDTVDMASTQAVSLVNDMLETARLDKNRFELNYEEFDVKKVVGDAVKVMSKTAGDEVGISANLPEDEEVLIEADKVRIREALYALMSNAIKYKDPNKEETLINIDMKERDGKVIISIEDNGIGIKPRDIAKLGRKFFRLNPKLHGNLKRPGGTGLGLFVVKGIMQHHGGKLKIESEGLYKGSRFTMIFPVRKTMNKSDRTSNKENSSPAVTEE